MCIQIFYYKSTLGEPFLVIFLILIFGFILLFEICYFVSNFNHLKLQIPNNFKFKFFFVGRIPKKTLTHNEFVSFDVHESNYKGEQRNQLQFHELTTILLQNCNTIPKMFEPF